MPAHLLAQGVLHPPLLHVLLARRVELQVHPRVEVAGEVVQIMEDGAEEMEEETAEMKEEAAEMEVNTAVTHQLA